MEDQFAKQVAANKVEKTGIEKIRELIEFEHFDEAMTLCNGVLLAKKGDRDCLTQKFRACVLSGRLYHESIPSIIADLEKLHPLCMKDPEYIETKFDYLIKINNIRSAEDHLPHIKAVFGERNSKYSGCVAQVLIKQNQTEEAMNLINHGLKLNEYDGDLFELKGDIFFTHLNSSELALEQYKYSMQMNKRNPLLFQKMAKILFDKHFYGEAVQNVSVALEQITNQQTTEKSTHITQQQRQCILLRGKSLVFLKEFEEAQQNFQRILDFDEKCIESRMGKAVACMFRGKSDQAIAIYKKGEELNAVFPGYMSWMALAYFLRKDYDNCEIFLKKYNKKLKELSEEERAHPSLTKTAACFELLNHVNFFYLDESYAKASFEKTFSLLDFEALGLYEIELSLIRSLSKFESVKRNLIEYLQQLMLYLIGGVYRWYPEDLYQYLLKHNEVEAVKTNLAHIFAIIDRNQKSERKKYTERVQKYTQNLQEEADEVHIENIEQEENSKVEPIISQYIQQETISLAAATTATTTTAAVTTKAAATTTTITTNIIPQQQNSKSQQQTSNNKTLVQQKQQEQKQQQQIQQGKQNLQIDGKSSQKIPQPSSQANQKQLQNQQLQNQKQQPQQQPAQQQKAPVKAPAAPQTAFKTGIINEPRTSLKPNPNTQNQQQQSSSQAPVTQTNAYSTNVAPNEHIKVNSETKVIEIQPSLVDIISKSPKKQTETDVKVEQVIVQENQILPKYEVLQIKSKQIQENDTSFTHSGHGKSEDALLQSSQAKHKSTNSYSSNVTHIVEEEEKKELSSLNKKNYSSETNIISHEKATKQNVGSGDTSDEMKRNVSQTHAAIIKNQFSAAETKDNHAVEVNDQSQEQQNQSTEVVVVSRNSSCCSVF